MTDILIKYNVDNVSFDTVIQDKKFNLETDLKLGLQVAIRYKIGNQSKLETEIFNNVTSFYINYDESEEVSYYNFDINSDIHSTGLNRKREYIEEIMVTKASELSYNF